MEHQWHFYCLGSNEHTHFLGEPTEAQSFYIITNMWSQDSDSEIFPPEPRSCVTFALPPLNCTSQLRTRLEKIMGDGEPSFQEHGI